VHAGSFVSVNDPRFHFGLGQLERIDRVIVTWPDGTERKLEDVAPDQLVRVARGG